MDEEYQYDVAISFAEEDKNAALALAQALEKESVKVYYYPDDRNMQYGADLEKELERIYFKEAKYSIILFSKHYLDESKVYTKIELAAIQKRMQEDADIVYMLPVRLEEDVQLSEYPNLDKLIYFKWKYAPEIIAQAIKKLLGKELISTDENPGVGNIIYNSDDRSLFISESNGANVNQGIIFSTGDNSIVITKKDVENVNIQQVIFSSPKETKYPCPNCSVELDEMNYGINQCHNCGKICYIENPAIDARKYKTLDKLEAKEFNKIRCHIRNKITERNYKAAYQYCLEAEEIAPGESSTWEHFALTEFLLEIYRGTGNRLKTYEIIRIVKFHTEKCKVYGISNEDYEGLVLDIANRLFALEKSRINSLRAQYRDDLGYEKWTRPNLNKLKDHLRSFEICYNLFKDTLYLEEYVKELTKPNKWVEKTHDGSIENTQACGSFNAYEKIKSLEKKIKEKKDDYLHPLIAEKPFVILSVEAVEEETNTNINSLGDNTPPDEINILSIE